MAFSITQVALVSISYLLILFFIAFSTDRGWIPARIVRHPATYLLSMGAFTSAWAYYGIIDLAFQFGYGALAYYLGAGALFLFAPIVILPVAQLASRFQINNLADLMVFRFHSHVAGSLTTVCMLMVFMPSMALQLQAVADTLQILTSHSPSGAQTLFSLGPRESLALVYCILLAVFTIAFSSNREQSPGLVVAMAFESLVKILALGAIGLFAVYTVFDGFGGLERWLQEHPENLELLHDPIQNMSSHTLLLVFMASAVAVPQLFNASGHENFIKNAGKTLSWASPLLFLLLALPIFPILWAGFATDVPLPPQYFPLGIPMQLQSVNLTFLAFIGGLSAATGAMITLSLALATMLLNQWILPITRLSKHNLYEHLFLLRATIIVAMFSIGYIFYKILNNNFSLTDLALMGFIESLQFLPALISVSNWPKANCKGYITGLCLGSTVWLIGAVLPALTSINSLTLPLLDITLPLGIEYWDDITLLSLGLNIAAFAGISMLTKSSTEEQYSAELCTKDELSHPLRMILDVHSAEEFSQRLSETLGPATAEAEVQRAMQELGLSSSERRPYSLRRLRDKLEGNLSGLLGTTVANVILDKSIPYLLPDQAHERTDINLIETQLTQYRSQLTGLAAELNNLRLYHRNTLEELPMAACSLGLNNEILLWNQSMEQLTQIPAESIIGSSLDSLDGPWFQILNDFSTSPYQHLQKQKVEMDGYQHWINLHKASIHTPAADTANGQVFLLEDMTENQILEAELIHTERLASIGRLAAGVAHEIGNPITGIACLAQNLRYETEDPNAAAETADQILSQTERVRRIVQSLMSFSHSGSNHDISLQKTYLRECAREAIQLLALQQDDFDICFTNQIDSSIELNADPQKLIQVFINLLTNARDASQNGSEVLLQAESDTEQVAIHIIDQGYGISEQLKERILEPFFTTKDPGSGTGLGLSLVYSIVKEHQGQMEIFSPPPNRNRGTQITIKLPLGLETNVNSGNTVA